MKLSTVLVLALCVLVAGSVPAQDEVGNMFGLCLGSAQTALGLQTMTIGAQAHLPLTPWFMIVLDAAIARNKYSTVETSGSFSVSEDITLSGMFVDALASAYSEVGKGGYMYAGFGLAYGTIETKTAIAQSELKVEYGSPVGFSFGAGMVVPIEGNFVAFGKIRQRMLTGALEDKGSDSSWKQDIPIGGPEIAVGVGIRL